MSGDDVVIVVPSEKDYKDYKSSFEKENMLKVERSKFSFHPFIPGLSVPFIIDLETAKEIIDQPCTLTSYFNWTFAYYFHANAYKDTEVNEI